MTFAASLDGDAELLTKDSLDALHVVFHKHEFLLRICEALEKVIEGARKAIEFFHETLLQLVNAFVHSVKAPVNGVKTGLKVFVLSRKTRLRVLVVRGEPFIDRLENDAGLL